MNHMVSIGERLREERGRLGLAQPALGAVGGVTKKTQMLYEAGERSPDAAYLAAIAAAGADVLYILTGERSQAIPPQALLPEGDRILLDNFHAAPPQVRDGVKTALGAFAPGAGTAAKRGKAA